jgi:predicted AAA+ superfamily ATPase
MGEFYSRFQKYNFWDKHVPKLGYLRQGYLDKIFQFCNNSLVKVLVGQRRTGKSYLLRQIAYNFIQNGVPAKNIFFINKEFIEFDEIKDYKYFITFSSILKNFRTIEGCSWYSNGTVKY